MSHFIAQPKQGVPFVSVQAMAKLINSLGIENVLLELTLTRGCNRANACER